MGSQKVSPGGDEDGVGGEGGGIARHEEAPSTTTALV